LSGKPYPGKKEERKMIIKNRVRKFFLSIFKDLHKDILRAILIFIALMPSNLVEQGMVVKLLGGVPMADYFKFDIDMDKISEGKIYRSDDLLEEKEELRKTITMQNKGLLLVSAHAGGKYKDSRQCDKDGFVEVFVYVDDIECAHSSAFVGKSKYRNDSKSLSTAAAVFIPVDEGEHAVKVIAVYYGNLESDRTKFQYLTICNANKN
jgi:hypothetical protein